MTCLPFRFAKLCHYFCETIMLIGLLNYLHRVQINVPMCITPAMSASSYPHHCWCCVPVGGWGGGVGKRLDHNRCAGSRTRQIKMTISVLLFTNYGFQAGNLTLLSLHVLSNMLSLRAEKRIQVYQKHIGPAYAGADLRSSLPPQ